MMTKQMVDNQVMADQSLLERRQNLEKEFQEKSALLDSQVKVLEERRDALNDREPQHERRRLREHLNEQLKNVILSPPSSALARERSANYYYFLASLLFIALSSLFAYLSSFYQSGNTAAFWTQSVKSLAAGVAGAAFAWAGLSGLKSAAQANRQYQQDVQRYSFDIDRASWAMETILQMSQIEKSQVPEQWLEAVCRDLFAAADARPEEARPLDALAALLDVTAKARLGTNGFDFEINRKGARKLTRVQRDS